ncbi:MAG TPA: O-antigen ligase family protein [Moheibacter sp.]|nr:O-antigen ligase family protein [Moheibacter sp.]
MKSIGNKYTIAFSSLLAIIPFTEHIQIVPNILIGILLLLFPFVIKKRKWIKPNSTIIYLLISLILTIGLGIIAHERWEDISFLIKIITIPIILILSLPIKDHRIPLYSFLISSFTLLLISIINLTFHYFTYHSLNLDVGADVNKLLMSERPYLGFIYLISFCLSLYLKRFQKSKWSKILLNIMAVIFSAFILYISARLSILSLLIIIGSSVFYAKNKKRTFLLSFGSMLTLAAFGFLNPNFISRLTAGFSQDKIEMQKVIQLEPRTHIWECSYNISQSDSMTFWGLGFRNTIKNLKDCFSTHDKFLNKGQQKFFIDSNFNTHNQFLNFYLSSGFLSLLLFLILFFVLFKIYRGNYYSFALILALFLFCIFENVISRQIGAMLFAIVLYLAHSILKNTSKSDLMN